MADKKGYKYPPELLIPSSCLFFLSLAHKNIIIHPVHDNRNIIFLITNTAGWATTTTEATTFIKSSKLSADKCQGWIRVRLYFLRHFTPVLT